MGTKVPKYLLALCCAVGVLGWAQAPQDSAKPDNSAVNQRDRDKAMPTADQQKETPADRDTAKKIRQSIMQDKSLSTYAHNIKIIAQNGTITLRGPVRSDEEKQLIEKKAAEVAGDANVKSEIEVSPKSNQ